MQKKTNLPNEFSVTFITILHLIKNQVIPTGSEVIVVNIFESHLK